ncbi:hypothetical protein MCAL160_0619 [Mycoplasmopsis californica HAZ160_1]|uniref:Extracellular matrix-binding protein ebh GA module domain-containing protein n=1 Tax=Mycoplasmopsis californica HAZ160_1 TaxID=1397850 RepID=A0AAT9F8A5_9BACT|nr:GA module-containing protein [Mycoplasmopsis californica]BAP01118.1 hypothetical protein MCAL160_0619 [Mycoplasmopsis californica HAZ160_1]BBG40984.1 hypothetical protein MCAL106_0619 [Mycoplasmopsis californica]BBG41577.1 hypothetical protein MCAL106E_0619 [Mycoplasmopsis californica]BBG42171.1 hypothetical protein MCAL106L_0619 [Mycoplasmopsis californica]BBG42753.1 hypothetical protein MCAL160E_0619 [Mycoplasmopsis californica]
MNDKVEDDMKKSVKRGLFNSLVIAAGAASAGTTAITISHTSGLSASEIDKIIGIINEQSQKTQQFIQKLDKHYNSVDSLESVINETQEQLSDIKAKYQELNKDQYKQYNKIRQALKELKDNISSFENKIVQSRERLKENKSNLDKIVNKAKNTSQRAIKKLNNTSEINTPGLKIANKELLLALKELEEARKKATDSREHVDNLIKIASKVDIAEKKVANLVKELESLSVDQLKQRWLQEMQKHIIELNDGIAKSAKLGSDVEEITKFIENLAQKAVVAQDTSSFIDSNPEELNTEISNKNTELKQVIEITKQTLSDLSSKLNQIKDEIKQKINSVEKEQNESQSIIKVSKDFQTLEKELNNSKLRLSGPIKEVKNQANLTKYQEAIEKISVVEKQEHQIAENILNKLKSILHSELDNANLDIENKQKLNSLISESNSVDQLKNAQNQIKLAKLKNELINQVKVMDLISKEHKITITNEIKSANTQDSIQNISSSINNLQQQKQIIHEKIKGLSNLSDKQILVFYDKIVATQDLNALNEIYEQAINFEKTKQKSKQEISELKNLSQSDKNNIYVLLQNGTSNREIELILQNAKDLDNAKRKALSDLTTFSDLNTKENQDFASEIASAKTKELVDELLKKASQLNEIKKNAKSEIENHSNLSQNSKDNFKKVILESLTTEEIEKIKNQAAKLNQDKQDIIDKIQVLNNFSSEVKNEFANSIKNNDTIEKVSQIYNAIIAVENGKKDVAKLIEQSNINDKDSLKNQLQNGKTQEDVDILRKKVELEIKKVETIAKINEISKLSPQKQQELIDKIQKATSPATIEVIISEAKGETFKVDVAKAKEEIEKLNWIAESEKNKISKELDSLTESQKTQIKEKLDALKNKNKQKEDLYNNNIASSIEFNQEYKNKIKKNIIESSLQNDWDKIKDEFKALEKVKTDIKDKIQNEFNYLGTKDKQDFIVSLKEKDDNQGSQKILQDANNLNDFKKNLIDKITELTHVNTEKQAIIDKIKNEQTRSQATKFYEDLLLKSQKEEAKLKIEQMDSLKNHKQNFKDQIDRSVNKTLVDSVLEAAKMKNELNKAVDEAKYNINKLDLISDEHKNELKNQLDAKNNIEEVKKLVNEATDLNGYKKEKEFTKLNLTKLRGNSGIEAEFGKKLKDAKTKSSVDTIVREYQEWNQKITQAHNKVDTFAKLDPSLKTGFKDEISKANKNEIEGILTRAERLNNTNINNIAALNSFKLLNNAYKKKIETEITQQEDETKSNSKLDEARRLSKTKENTNNEIKSNSFLTNQQKNNFESQLIAVDDEKGVQKVKAQAQKDQKKKSDSINKISRLDYLSAAEKENAKKQVVNANLDNQIDNSVKNAESLNGQKKQIANQIDSLTLLPQVLKTRAKNNIKNANGIPAAQKILDNHKAFNTKKQNAKKSIDSFNHLETTQKNKYKDRIDKLEKQNQVDGIVNEARKENDLVKSKKESATINEFTYLSEKEKTQFKQLIEKQKNVPNVKKEFEKAKKLNNDKKMWADKINGLGLISQGQKSSAIEQIKKQDGAEKAKAKFNELNGLNDKKKPIEKTIQSSNKITQKGKQDLKDELLDKTTEQELNSINEGIQSWNSETDKNAGLIDTAQKVKAEVQKLAKIDNNSVQSVLNSLNSLISTNTKNNNDSLSQLKSKNNNLESEISKKYNELNKAMQNFSNNFRSKIFNSQNLHKKDALLKLKQEFDSSIQTYKNINTQLKTRFGDSKINQSEFNKVIKELEEVSKLLNEQIDLTKKYDELKNTIDSGLLSESHKAMYRLRIESNLGQDTASIGEFEKLKEEIETKIKENQEQKTHFDKKNEMIKKSASALIVNLPNNNGIKSSNQSMSVNYKNIADNYKNAFNDILKENNVKKANSELDKIYEMISMYEKGYTDLNKYISQRGQDEATKNQAWTKFDTLSSNLRVEMTKIITNGSNPLDNEFRPLDSYNNVINQKSYFDASVKEVKEIIFRKEVDLIQKEWIKDTSYHQASYKIQYVVIKEKNGKKEIHVTKNPLSNRFKNMNIKFVHHKSPGETIQLQTDWTKKYFITADIIISSGDGDGLEYKIEDVNVKQINTVRN